MTRRRTDIPPASQASVERRRRRERESQRRRRERERAGIVVLRVEVDEIEAADMLVRLGYLQPTLADDRSAIERAAAALLTNVRLPDRVTRDNAESADVPSLRHTIRRTSR